MGTGINRIKEECKKHGNIKFQIETDGFFIAVFKLKKVREVIPKISDRLVEGLVEGLVESQKEILRLISQNTYISKQELSNKIGISTTAIDKNISRLKQKSLLKRVGPAKGGYWEIIKKEVK